MIKVSVQLFKLGNVSKIINVMLLRVRTSIYNVCLTYLFHGSVLGLSLEPFSMFTARTWCSYYAHKIMGSSHMRV